MVENLTNFRTNENAPFLFRIVDVILLIASFFVVSTAYQVPFNKDYLLLLTFTIAVFLFFAESAQLYKKLRLGKFPQRAMVVFAVISLSFLSVTLALFLIQEEGISHVLLC